MIRISRYILIFTAIVALSVSLPKLYWMVMEKPVGAPMVRYSCTDKTYLILRPGSPMVRQDSKGKSYTREEYEQKLPLMYCMQLASSGTLPDTINGIAMDIHTIRKANSSYRFQPKFMDSPQPGLYPLFESESGRVSLEMPNDFFRIQSRLEFVDAKSNKVDEKKSTLFSDALANRGFVFPAKLIAGLPTTKKSCDEGYLITDSKEQLFHLKMEVGKPYVKKVNLTDSVQFKWIECVDFPNKLFYAYLISSTNEVYILLQDTYVLMKLPVSGFNSDVDELKIYGDLFNYNVIVEGDSYVRAFTLDNHFKLVDEYTEKWNDRYHRFEGKIFSYIFPFEMNLKSENSRFINFRLNITGGVIWFLLSMLLIGVEMYLITRKKNRIADHVLDLCIIAVCGIFGFIAVIIFPNKVFK